MAQNHGPTTKPQSSLSQSGKRKYDAKQGTRRANDQSRKLRKRGDGGTQKQQYHAHKYAGTHHEVKGTDEGTVAIVGPTKNRLVVQLPPELVLLKLEQVCAQKIV